MANAITTESVERKPKYSKILNNLLSIQGIDQNIFTGLNGTTDFDLITKFGEDIALRSIMQESFAIKLVEKDLDSLLEIVKKANNGEEVLKAYDFYKMKLFKKKKELLINAETFNKTKDELVNDLMEKIQKSSTRWNQFREK